MNISIRKATEKDLPIVYSLTKEFAVFLGKSSKVKTTLEDFQNNKDIYQCLLAETEKGEVVGYALFFCTFHSWTGKAIYLDDLYVRETARRNSVGTMLMCALMDVGRQYHCNTLKWQVLNDNEFAIDFYKKVGAIVGDDNLNCEYKL